MSDIRSLLNTGLIDPMALPSINAQASVDEGSALVVKRQVREYLYATLNINEIRRLHKRALVLYFGDNWSSAGIRPMREIRFSDKHCSSTRITNANLIIRRAVSDAAASGDKAAIKTAFDLALAYAQGIRQGHHYEGISALLSSILPITVDAAFLPSLTELQLAYARALRMCGNHEPALNIIMDLDVTGKVKDTLQDIALEKTLSLDALGRTGEAVAAAVACETIDPKSWMALHAKSIIIKNDYNDQERYSKLSKIEAVARKKKWHVVANNIALQMASIAKDGSNVWQKISANSAREGDYYNSVRALLAFLKTKVAQNLSLTPQERSKLIDAYHYLYGENMAGLFDDCHALLWSAFNQDEDMVNLTSLFKQSSLVWRVRDRLAVEERYIKKLASISSAMKISDIRAADKNTAYFLSRSVNTSLMLGTR